MEHTKKEEVYEPGIPDCVPPFSWSEEDTRLTRLFQHCGGLPLNPNTTIETALGLLATFDALIVSFEERTHHSDDGLRAWRENHKKAIESQIVDLPGYPPLKILHQGVLTWNDKAWETRYSYLVEQRRRIIDKRLTQIGIAKKLRTNFFRKEPEQPRRPILAHDPTGRLRTNALHQDWWQPVSFLLKRLGHQLPGNPDELARKFWNPPPGLCWEDATDKSS